MHPTSFDEKFNAFPSAPLPSASLSLATAPQSSSSYSSITSADLDLDTWYSDQEVASMPQSPQYPAGVVAGQQQYLTAQCFLPGLATSPHPYDPVAQTPRSFISPSSSHTATAHPWPTMPSYTHNPFAGSSSTTIEPTHPSMQQQAASGSSLNNRTHLGVFHAGTGPSTALSGRRERIARACNKCRFRKIRCTGGRECDYCEVRGLDCIYEAPRPRGPNKANRGAHSARRHHHKARPPPSARSDSRSSDGTSAGSFSCSPPQGEPTSLTWSQPPSPARSSQSPAAMPPPFAVDFQAHSGPSSSGGTPAPSPPSFDPSGLVLDQAARRRAATFAALQSAPRPASNVGHSAPTLPAHDFYPAHSLDEVHSAYMQANMRNCASFAMIPGEITESYAFMPANADPYAHAAPPHEYAQAAAQYAMAQTPAHYPTDPSTASYLQAQVPSHMPTPVSVPVSMHTSSSGSHFQLSALTGSRSHSHEHPAQLAQSGVYDGAVQEQAETSEFQPYMPAFAPGPYQHASSSSFSDLPPPRAISTAPWPSSFFEDGRDRSDVVVSSSSSLVPGDAHWALDMGPSQFAMGSEMGAYAPEPSMSSGAISGPFLVFSGSCISPRVIAVFVFRNSTVVRKDHSDRAASPSVNVSVKRLATGVSAAPWRPSFAEGSPRPPGVLMGVCSASVSIELRSAI
ncbi:uncharacterized protein BXZ73DRAFT_81309 [Epithele typhae]|uniref:uncharacterized protein n=1 Tax=Epithele typhae TaxID=378194 RepID=UPI0020088F55|nr:uncharacterized protein BXZ73DRAFT_81309 [Epithele typhae]KAH9915579.1 hypothetical protein BXZ73DRAFT_81309 [Epithele typhae]